MGLDILRNGGIVVRVLIQGCLILWLCFIPSLSFAAWLNEPDSAVKYTYNTASSLQDAQSKLSDVLAACNSNYPQGCYGDFGEKYGQFRYVVWYFANPDTACPEGQSVNDAGYCDIASYEPEQCHETGMAYDDETQQCTDYCEWGMLNGICMSPPPADNDEQCNEQSANFRGQIGYGDQRVNICSKDVDGDGTEDRPNACQTGSGGKGALGMVGDQLVCVPDDYANDNICDADEIYIVDDYGVICAGLENQPAPQPEPEQPNEDTDGDGQPDQYNPDNDPNINRKQLDDIRDGQKQSNKSLGNIEKIGKGTNDRLDDIGSELENNSKGIGEVVGFTRQSSESLAEIKDGMKAPEGGFNPDGFGGLIPTFEETGNAFIQAIGSSPQVQALTDFATIPQVNNCPVYTLPATPVSGEITMDIHCSIIERHRSMIGAVFMFFWVGLSLLIFFKA